MPENQFVLMMYDRAHPISAMLVHVAAGLFLLWVTALIWEGVLFKRVTQDPVIGKLCAAVVGWATLFAVRIGAHMAVPGVVRDYDLIALALLCGLAVWSGLRLRAQIRLEEEEG